MTNQPGAHLWVFVSGVVVDDGVDDLAGSALGLPMIPCLHLTHDEADAYGLS